MAGGVGSRLWPLTAKVPKPMVAVTNQSMISYAIDHLRYAGLRKIVVVVRHMGDLLREHIQKVWTPERLGGVVLEVPHVDSRGTADAVRLVSERLDAENLVVSMGDIVTNLPLREMMEFHERKGGVGTISMKTVESPSQYGVVLIDKAQKIYLFLEKPKPQELYLSSLAQRTDLYLHTNIINTGIYCFRREIFDVLAENPTLMDFGRDVFPYLLENQFEVFGFVKDYYWMDVGIPQTYKWANWDLLRKYGYPVTPSGQEVGGAWVTPSSRHLMEEGVVQAPAALGENVRAGRGATIKPLSVLGNDVVLGSGVVVDRSIIWDRVEVGDNAQVIDSIVCNDCRLGAGVIVRNNSVVGPGSTLEDGVVLDNEVVGEDSVVRLGGAN